MAQGLHQMSPQTVQYDDDVYKPNLDDLEEGSRDSEESLDPSPTGLSAGMQGFDMGSQRTGSGSGGKRQRGEGSSRSKRKTRSRTSADPDLSVLSRIADVLESREDRLRGKITQDEDDIPSVHDCTKFLYTLDAIKEDAPFRLRCINMVECPIIRKKIQLFQELSTEDLVEYLRLVDNDPPEWLRPYI